MWRGRIWTVGPTCSTHQPGSAWDCLQWLLSVSPSPNTVADIGATVHPLSLHRRPPPPPLPSRFFLSPAKWMGTLRRIPPPLPSPTRPRARNTPRRVLQANQERRNRRRRRYPSIHPLPRFGFLAPGGDQKWGSLTWIRLPASWTADPADPCEDAAAVRLCPQARRLRGLGQREVIDSAIDLRWAICFIRASRSKVRFVTSPISTPTIESVSQINVSSINTRV
jgi:hypothetical protein